MSAGPFLSVVIPVIDEAENLEPLHRELDAALASVRGGVEFVYVDDGSRDDSAARLAALAAADPRVRVLRFAENRGQSAALDAGFKAARGVYTATLDADGQNDPADLPRLLAATDRADVVNGQRVTRRDGWLRRVSSKVGNGFRNWATDESVTDVGCSLRVMRTALLRRVKLFRGMHRFLPTLLRMEGARVVEMPVNHRRRRHGRSKYGVANRLFVGLADVLAVRWMQRRRLDYRIVEVTEEAAAPGRDAARG
ncbi:MAG: glycosyltransferase family 2 protein [Myxococcota bacterium]|nr:glycosyltransferase family 2 protein [Myxococcota bacterium]